MGHWYLVLFCCFCLAMFGLFTHWSLLLIAAMLPFIPMLSLLLRRRRERRNVRAETESKN